PAARAHLRDHPHVRADRHVLHLDAAVVRARDVVPADIDTTPSGRGRLDGARSAPMNLHIVRNGVSHDSRGLKETRSLRESGLFAAVHIAGFEQAGLSEHEDLGGRTVWRVPLATRALPKDLLSQSIKYGEWRHRIVSAYERAPLTVIHCHDLEPLGIA